MNGELSDEERQLQETVHKFAAEVMRPAGNELDALTDPQDVIAEGSILWDVFDKQRALEFYDQALPLYKQVGDRGGEATTLTGDVCLVAVGASWSVTKQLRGYFIMFLLLQTGMMGVFCALDFFLFYVFWEVMLVPMYLLIVI